VSIPAPVNFRGHHRENTRPNVRRLVEAEE
jgi:hypothetical protein